MTVFPTGDTQIAWTFPEKNEASIPPDISPLKPTPVYDTYWRFAAERQRVFVRRLAGDHPPWSTDPIINSYKFTNAYRASDRVSQYLIRNVIHGNGRSQSPVELFFRILLFKIFNRINTWELLEQELGPITYSEYNFDSYDAVLGRAMDSRKPIYSAAYIMPSARPFGYERKHQNHLALIDRMIAEEVPDRLISSSNMQQAFELLRSYPTIGDFLAYQYVTDINYSQLTDFSEMEFVVAGPGAIGGIRKCFEDRTGLNDAEIIQFVTDRQETEFSRLGLEFQPLGDRRLQLIDCQNLFCEVNKYARVRHPEYNGSTGRTRIKQRFHASSESIDYWYPPKWGINTLPTAQNSQMSMRVPQSDAKGGCMDLNAYQEAAKQTNRNSSGDENAILIPLLGIAGEAGELLSEYKKYLRDADSHTLFRDRFAEELGDLLWYLATVADQFELTLQEVAELNLKKNQERWGEIEPKPPFDATFPSSERFPRLFEVDLNTVHDADGKPTMKAFYKGKSFGNDLTDNAYEIDGYRFHDVFHLAFAAVLGWSPITRKLLESKRRSDLEVDEIEDGGRARVIEEGISALIFAYAKDYKWLEGKASVSAELLRAIKNMTCHLEVSRCTTGEWENAIIQGYGVWREVKSRGGGTLIVDLDQRTLSIKEY